MVQRKSKSPKFRISEAELARYRELIDDSGEGFSAWTRAAMRLLYALQQEGVVTPENPELFVALLTRGADVTEMKRMVKQFKGKKDRAGSHK